MEQHEFDELEKRVSKIEDALTDLLLVLESEEELPKTVRGEIWDIYADFTGISKIKTTTP